METQHGRAGTLALVKTLILAINARAKPSYCWTWHEHRLLTKPFKSSHLGISRYCRDALFRGGKINMKFHCFSILFVLMASFLLGIVFADQQWQFVESLENPISFQDIHFFDRNTGLAVNTTSEVYKTEDGGRSWKQPFDLEPLLITIFNRIRLRFVSQKTGFLVPFRGSRYYKTTDGGETWKENREDRVATIDVSFLNDQKGWLLQYDVKGRKGKVLSTDNGGETWTTYRLPVENIEFLEAIQFSTEKEGWIVGKDATLFHTQNGGQTWGDVSRRIRPLVERVEAAKLTDIYFRDPRTGWLIGEAGTILHTRDGGASWRFIQPQGIVNLNAVVWTDIAFINDQTGFLVGGPPGESNLILHTRDGGVTWEVMRYRMPLVSLFFISDQVGWIAGAGNTLLQTQDGGITWTPLLPVNFDYKDISFYAPKHGYIVGSGHWTDVPEVGVSELRHTTGAGTWEPPIAIDVPLRRVAFITTDIGWGVSDYPWQLWYTTNVSQWQQIHPQRVYALDFADASHGVAGGRDHVLRTADAKRWEVINLGDVSIWSVFMLDDQQAWLAGAVGNGNGPVIFHSTDGGKTWESQLRPGQFVESIVDITFADAHHGWALSGGLPIFTTTDGGKHWEKQFIPIYGWGALMLSPQEGWIVGTAKGKGAILHTTNGGQSWEEMVVETPNELLAIAYDGDNRLVAVGENRTLLEYVDDDLKKYAGSFAVNPKGLRLSTWGKQKLQLLPIYPNPANPEAWIPYRLPKAAQVVLTITDISGQLVRELRLGHQAAGVYDSKANALYWDGKTDGGEAVASGIYFCTVQVGDQTATRKVVILK